MKLFKLLIRKQPDNILGRIFYWLGFCFFISIFIGIFYLYWITFGIYSILILSSISIFVFSFYFFLIKITKK